MILVVEDNVDDSDLLIRQLARAKLGDRVRVIGDGQTALDFLLECDEPPLALLLDLRLPRLSGIELLKRIRAEERLRALPVMVMTSSLNPRDVEACTGLGVATYLQKPVEITTLARVLHLVLTEMPMST